MEGRGPQKSRRIVTVRMQSLGRRIPAHLRGDRFFPPQCLPTDGRSSRRRGRGDRGRLGYFLVVGLGHGCSAKGFRPPDCPRVFREEPQKRPVYLPLLRASGARPQRAKELVLAGAEGADCGGVGVQAPVVGDRGGDNLPIGVPYTIAGRQWAVLESEVFGRLVGYSLGSVVSARYS